MENVASKYEIMQSIRRLKPLSLGDNLNKTSLSSTKTKHSLNPEINLEEGDPALKTAQASSENNRENHPPKGNEFLIKQKGNSSVPPTFKNKQRSSEPSPTPSSFNSRTKSRFFNEYIT